LPLHWFRIASIFRHPIDPKLDKCRDYFDVIDRLMDLGTILSNLERNRYGSFSEFCSDMELVWRNATDCNGPNSMVALLAVQLRRCFNDIIEDMSDYEVGDWVTKLAHLETVGASFGALPLSIARGGPERPTTGGKRPRGRKAPAVYHITLAPIHDRGEPDAPRPEPQKRAENPPNDPPKPKPPPAPPKPRQRQRHMSKEETLELADAIKSLDDEDEDVIMRVVAIIRQNEPDMVVEADSIVDLLNLSAETRWQIRELLDSLIN
jgi:bromodomain-containing protein 3